MFCLSTLKLSVVNNIGIKELNLCEEPADIKIPKTIKELLTEYAFNPANELAAEIELSTHVSSVYIKQSSCL